MKIISCVSLACRFDETLRRLIMSCAALCGDSARLFCPALFSPCSTECSRRLTDGLTLCTSQLPWRQDMKGLLPIKQKSCQEAGLVCNTQYTPLICQVCFVAYEHDDDITSPLCSHVLDPFGRLLEGIHICGGAKTKRSQIKDVVCATAEAFNVSCCYCSEYTYLPSVQLFKRGHAGCFYNSCG